MVLVYVLFKWFHIVFNISKSRKYTWISGLFMFNQMIMNIFQSDFSRILESWYDENQFLDAAHIQSSVL